MNENNQADLLLEVGITDFWNLNSFYNGLVTTADIKNINNCDLLVSIEVNFKSFNDFDINNQMKNNQNSYNDSDSYSDKVIENDIEVQAIFIWRFQHYWLNSISAKMNLFKIRVNQILRKYKLHVKMLLLKKLGKWRKVNLVINDQQIDQINQYIELASSTPMKISMIKQAVWPQISGVKAQCNSTLSKVLRKKLCMSYKVLHKWNTKRKDTQTQPLFIECLYLQTKLRNEEIEAIYWWIYAFITELEYTEDGNSKESILEFEKAKRTYLF